MCVYFWWVGNGSVCLFVCLVVLYIVFEQVNRSVCVGLAVCVCVRWGAWAGVWCGWCVCVCMVCVYARMQRAIHTHTHTHAHPHMHTHTAGLEEWIVLNLNAMSNSKVL